MKKRKLCPMCETFGAGPCNECDALNKPVLKKRRDPRHRFMQALNKSIKFHQTNTNDPHGIGNAVTIALVEVRNCFKRAYL